MESTLDMRVVVFSHTMNSIISGGTRIAFLRFIYLTYDSE